MDDKVKEPLYIICLDSKLKERGNKALKRFSEVFENVKCHRAKTPKDFNKNDNDDFSWLLNDKILTKTRDSDCDMTDWKQVGCYLSHVEAWKYCVDKKEPIYVGEDDVYIKDIPSFKRMLDTLPNCKFASILNIHGSNYKQVGTGPWASLEGHVTGTQLYYITPECAKILLKYAFPILCHVDVYMTILLPQKMNIKSIFVNRLGNSNWKSLSESTLNHKEFNVKPLLTEFRAKVLIVVIVLLLCINSYLVIKLRFPKINLFMKENSK
tara:strand:+ start:1199 stop:1999 length:801 start_codon:yes stop_codon:yes gene_type:complete